LEILAPDGTVDANLDPELPKDQLLKLYRSMLLAREVDAKGLKLQRQGRIGTFGPQVGQEAVSCGAALALTDKDWLVPAFREAGAMFMRGWPVENFYLFHRGFEEGNRYPNGGRNLPISIVVGAHLPHAVGIGHAMRLADEKDSAILTFTGDGGSSQGDTAEAMNFAGVWKAPVVFVIQNNGWAISLPRSRQSAATTLAQKAVAAGIPGIQVDGNDALAVYRSVRDALARARAGDGPTVVEAVSYRLGVHTTSDDPSKYRDEEAVKGEWEKEPIRRLSLHLRKLGVLTELEDEDLRTAVVQEVAEATERFEASLDHPPDEPFHHVFAEPHYTIEEQRQEFLKWQR